MITPNYLSLYLVLDPDLCGGFEGMIKTTQQAVLGGVTCVQLRAPNWTKDQMVDCGKALIRLLRPQNIPLIVNNEADVCKQIDADGLHIGQSDIPAKSAREIIGLDKILGLSVSTMDELIEAETLPVDYYGVGPVFSTSTKPDAAAPCGLEGLKAMCDTACRPTVAIGGIHLANAADMIRAGTDGIAVVSAICGQKNPRKAAQDLLGIISKN